MFTAHISESFFFLLFSLMSKIDNHCSVPWRAEENHKAFFLNAMLFPRLAVLFASLVACKTLYTFKKAFMHCKKNKKKLKKSHHIVAHNKYFRYNILKTKPTEHLKVCKPYRWLIKL